MSPNRILIILAALAALGWATVQAETPTPAPTVTPAPILSITKSAFPSAGPVNPGDVIGFTITVTNSGNLAADVSVSDVLPSSVAWSPAMFPSGCSLSPAGVLSCQLSLDKRHLNDSQTEFLNGVSQVSVYGIAGACGTTYTNTALLIYKGAPMASNRSAIAVAACPTVAPTATPTSAPTMTPTPTQPPATATPTVAPTEAPTVAATPTLRGRAPLPPNTGNTPGGSGGESSWALYGFLAVALLGAGITSWMIRREQR